VSTDLRRLMRDLAEDAPPIDNRIALADRSYGAGRRRRRTRQLGVSGAAAVVVVAALFATLFVGSPPLAAQYGSSSGTRVSGYPSHIGRQFPVLDLPAKPGPIAGLMLGQGNHAWAVSANGHRWNVPGVTGNTMPEAALSPDGRVLAYPGPGNKLVVHDLVAGTTGTVPGINDDQEEGDGVVGYRIDDDSQMLISTDDRYLAFTDGATGNTVLVDLRAARVIRTIRSYQFAGWVGDDLAAVQSADLGRGQTVRALTLEPVQGGAVRQVVLQPSQPLGAVGANWAVVSGDGRSLAVLSGGGDQVQTLSRFDLASGRQLGTTLTVPPTFDNCPITYGVRVVYTHVAESSEADLTIAVSSDGRISTATTALPAVTGQVCQIWASGAFDGTAHSGLLLDRFSGWVVQWRAELGWGLGVLLLIAGAQLWNRRARRRRPARPGRDRGRVLVGSAVLLALPLAICALLTPFVFIPWGTGNLTSSQSALWWSPIDQAAARPGASDGVVASKASLRLGQQQGVIVLVVNNTGRDQRVSDPDAPEPPSPANVGLSVSTTSGTAEQARSLTYLPAGTIPDHQSRWVRFLLYPSECVSPGGSSTLSALHLRVKIGWTFRDVWVPIQPTMQVTQPAKAASGQKTC
jgi:hypothetical protein